MKTFPLLLAAAAVVVWVAPVQAQYKAPSQYFRKDSPQNNPGGQPANPGGQPRTPPAAPAQPKFKDVAVNTTFYFVTDTNRAFAWTKISATTAKNSVNGNTVAINAETPVQR